MIPTNIKISAKGGPAFGGKIQTLPEQPGVYFYFDVNDKLLYIGKATSLKARVGSYFSKAHDNRIAELVSRIARIDYIETPTVIEALVLEANQIHAKQPPYNVMLRDDKSFLYLTISNEDFPKPILMRGQELERLGVNPFDAELSPIAKKKFLVVFGPYTSSGSLKKALDLVRRSIPWTTCDAPEVKGDKRPCFDRHIKKCPGVCTGEISKPDYRKIIKKLILFFEGKKDRLVRQLIREMSFAAKAKDFELAAELRNQIQALEHIADVALITREDVTLPIVKTDNQFVDLDGRIEAYDISNISGTSAVGSMVVFENGKPAKEKYRLFKIKTVIGANDYAMLEEVMTRRLHRAELQPKAWPLPELMVIDGGEGQVEVVRRVMNLFLQATSYKLNLPPVIGLAKGFDRKQDRLVFDRGDLELSRVAIAGKEIFKKARDESHRFAVSYHRRLRSKSSGIKKRSG